MAPKPLQAPALFSLLVFLAVNYLVGYGIGIALTGSKAVAISLSLVTPCLSLLGIALFGAKPVIEETTFDEA
jgi:uncharacterized membrane protein YdfJ with MMPL/SSD domain